jgi:hypothetical protein
MQAPPQLSPDGRYWWDGQTWQPTPDAAAAPAAPLVPPAQDPTRPSWLAEGVQIPGPPPAAPPPGAAAYAPAEEAAPLWAPPPPKRHIITTVALWAGVILGGGTVLLGLLGVVVAQSAPPLRQQSEETGALVFLVVGAAVFFPTFLNLTGYGQIITASTGVVGAIFGGAFSELGIVGSVIVFLMIASTLVFISHPVGGARYGVPLAGIAIVIRRLWQGKWLGAGIVVAVWAVGGVITLVAAR